MRQPIETYAAATSLGMMRVLYEAIRSGAAGARRTGVYYPYNRVDTIENVRAPPGIEREDKFCLRYAGRAHARHRRPLPAKMVA